MKIDSNEIKIQKLLQEMLTKYGCHTVILYGSRARGDFGPHSDYDLLGIKKAGKKEHVARFDGEAYLDLFLFPESMLEDKDFLFHCEKVLEEARILIEERDIASNLIKWVKEKISQPIIPMDPNERNSLITWVVKTLERCQENTIMAQYRRASLQVQLLEIYFQLRGLRERGPKKNFEWLKKNDSNCYQLYEKCLDSNFEYSALVALCKKIIEV